MKDNTIRFITIPFFIVLLTCCTNNRSKENISNEVLPYPHLINMTEALQTKTELKLSDIADSIQYIVLSKEKDVLIGSVRSLRMNETNIYLKSDELVMRFDLSGKYLNTYGAIGRGPEEYLRGSVYSASPGFDRILIMRSMLYDYLIYKPTGEYMGKKDLPMSRNFFDFVALSDSAFLFTFYFVGSFMNKDVFNEMPGVAGLFDPHGKPLKIIEHPLKKVSTGDMDIKNVVAPNPQFTFFESRVVLSHKGDTIYEVTNNSIAPGFILNWGQIPHEAKIEELYFRQTSSTGKADIYLPLLETSTKAFIRGSKNDATYIIVYDKVTGRSSSVSSDDELPRFINNLDGGENFFPYWTNIKGNVWIVAEDALSFKKNHPEEFLSTSVAIDPGKKEKLRKFLSNLKEDDNPVLRIVYLKQNK